MEIEKENKLFEAEYLNAGGKAQELEKEDGEYTSSKAQIGWEIWQAAKSQAVPEGFVLIPRLKTLEIRHAMYMAQHYHMNVINPDEWDAVDKSYQAIIDTVDQAQEQSHETL